jgi:hypothetical protein
VTRHVNDEKPLWVTIAAGERRAGGSGGRSPAEPPGKLSRSGRVTVVGGSSGDAVTAGIYVFPEKVRTLGIPSGLGRLRDFLAWLTKSDEPVEAVEISKVVDVDRPEDLAEAEELAAAAAGRAR